MISKGCIYHIVRVQDTEAKPPTLQSIPVVKEFPNVFSDELSDDILVYSRLKTKHADYLRAVLKVLQETKLYAKFSKCEFWLNSMASLGHIISDKGITVDTQKIEAVKTCPQPTTPTEKLTQKAASFQWTDACDRSFQELKDRLTSGPFLALPEGSDGYAVYCEASRVGLGCVLMQNGKKQLNLRQRRWLELLKHYDVDILYHPGKANVVADALSHKSMGDARVTIQIIATSSLVAEVKRRQYEDPSLTHYKDTSLQKKKSPFGVTKDGVLRQVRRLRTKDIDSVKVLWRNVNKEEMTWEAEEDMQSRFRQRIVAIIISYYGEFLLEFKVESEDIVVLAE
ncbi:uncharacterized protein LOC132042629, partial [Lycium ferocissimum]|uniref:uncharacterized protein LOC132042629 n=1 Tax=Lycium ferocissimum TaxID=112874 RepID=UPI002814A9A8